MRASRILSVLLLLQTRGRLTALELANELEVSERTIYRDLAHLSAAGVPVFGERGEGGGYQLLDGYRTQLTGLTSDEASTLLLTGAPGPAAELGLGSLLAATRLKLLAALPADLREVATRAEKRFLLDPTAWAHARRPDLSQLRVIARAVWDDRQLELRHRPSRGGVARRVVQPLALAHKTGTWYLVASQDQRRPVVFRVDRIIDARLLEADAVRPADFVLADFWASWEHEYAASLPRFVTTVKLGPEAMRYRDAFGAASPREVRDEVAGANGWVRQTLVFDGDRVALAMLLALGPDVEVVDPPDLRKRLMELALATAQRNRDLRINNS